MGTYFTAQVDGAVRTVRAAMVDGLSVDWIDVDRPDVVQHVGRQVLRSKCESMKIWHKKVDCDDEAEVWLTLSLLADEDGWNKRLPSSPFTPTVCGPGVLYAYWTRRERPGEDAAELRHLQGSVDLNRAIPLDRVPQLLQLWNATRIPLVMPDPLPRITRQAAEAMLNSPDAVAFRKAQRALMNFSVDVTAAQPALTRATAAEAADLLLIHEEQEEEEDEEEDEDHVDQVDEAHVIEGHVDEDRVIEGNNNM
jgi:hypothetical protein